MKINLLFKLFLLSLLIASCKSNDDGPVYEGDLVISTLEQYNNFNYEYVFGTLTIENLDSPDLSKLNSLTDVGGLTIRNCGITSLSGLDNLKFINKDLILANNENLESICCLNKVERVESLQIIDHPNLNSISGLSGIKTVNDTLRIRFAPQLASLNGLQNLNKVNAPFNINEVGLITLDGLQNLREVESLYLYRLENLTDAVAWSQLTQIERSLKIEECDQLTTLSTPNLLSVNTIFLGSNPALQSVDFGTVFTDLEFVNVGGSTQLEVIRGLENVNRIGLLSLTELSSLEDLLGFSGLTEVSGNLTLDNLDTLTSFSGFGNLTSVAIEYSGNPPNYTEFLIKRMEGITSLSGLDNLQTIGQIRIENNASLATLDGTNLQTTIPIGCRIFIQDNANLTNYCDFRYFVNNANINAALIVENAYNPTLSQIGSSSECSL